jgi:hypothetical protein
MRQQMVFPSLKLREDYWDTFNLPEIDIEFLYNYLIETETPLTSQELVTILVKERIHREKAALEQQQSSLGEIYFPKEHYKKGQKLVFPAFEWRRGKVTGVRRGYNPDLGDFDVMQVDLENEGMREFASGLEDHILNRPPESSAVDETLDPLVVLDVYQDTLIQALEAGLQTHTDFVRIAGKWFPRALLVDINIGHLNLAEAVLDMAGGGPLPTSYLLEQIELPRNVNPKLLEFSMDLALQEDERFDEVGPAGKVLWFLKRLEPEQVLEPPIYLRYPGIDYERSVLSEDMLALELELADELSPLDGKYLKLDQAEVRLVFPHWRAGTLPLSGRIRHLFPTAYEAPRIRLTLVDGESGESFPAWVVRNKRYVYGLQEWYVRRGLQPGSIIRVQRGKAAGEVVLHSNMRRPSREWVRTVLVGSDGGVVFAMLKQTVQTQYDERMVIAVPDVEALDQVWEQQIRERITFERVVVNMVRELSKLNPQGHVHATELYAAMNVVRRCPPGPLLALLASSPWFIHVGDLHFRYNESEPV